MPTAADNKAAAIQEALQRVNNQTSFVQELLIDALGWPVDEAAQEIGDIAYEWSEDELRAAGLNEKIVGGKAYQIILPGNPWGIFVMEFANPDVFTTGRGMTGVLRRVLAGLVRKGRGGQSANLPRFTQDNLLFICNHNYERYRFAHFKSAPDGTGTPPMASFGWGPDDLDAVRTICEFNLRALEWPDALPATETDWLKVWSPAFDIEKVTKRFYQDYATVFHHVEKIIEKTTALRDDELRMFTQSLFNRLMFLRFIERKGWLTFPSQTGSRYLAALASAGGIGKRSLYASRLRPLFFEGLAEEDKQQSDAYGHVPLLNGGLFEKSELDDKVTELPDEVFTPIINQGGLFYRYNFTVEESTPLDIEVAVDPEMLGKVFEELVTGRHESGSYYTPRPVVAFMCREALKGHLADRTKTPEPAIAKLVDDHIVEGLTEAHAKEIIDALDNLKAVDPACGSGAYLLGLLQELIAIRRALQSDKLAADPGFLYDLKLHIISHNLYGVDIDPFATEIAKLRLWLSLAVEAEDPVPLPNLDFKIETGDSLLGPNPQEMPDLFREQLRTQADVLVALKRKHFTAHGKEKARLGQQIQREEDLLAIAAHSSLPTNVIDYRIQFAEAFAQDRGGFDILLMNPPYLSANRVPGDKRNEFAAYMAQLRPIYGFKSDLYIHFMFRALQLLADGGMFAAITSNTYLTNTTKEFLRERMLQAELRWLIPLGPDVFDATVYSGICIIKNREDGAGEIGFVNLRQSTMHALSGGRQMLAAGRRIPSAEYRTAFSHMFFDPTVENRRLFAGLLAADCELTINGRSYIPLASVAPALDTGIHSGNVRSRIFFESKPQNRRVWKMLQGKQVLRYWSSWDAPRAKYKYVDVEYDPDPDRNGIGRGGKPSGRGEYWHFCGPVENHHVTERLLMRQTEDEPYVGYIYQGNERIYTDNTLHTLLLTPEGERVGLTYRYLLAVLNSSTLRTIYRSMAQEEGRTLAQVKTTLVNRLPIAIPTDTERDAIEQLVEKIQGEYLNHGCPLPNDAASRVAAIQQQIDELVSRLYGLNGLIEPIPKA
ncbi:MAG: DNA methyltransferase [Phycisphaeraceae bacterium]